MSGMKRGELLKEELVMDPAAQNNARMQGIHDQLQFLVVTRHAAAACQLPRSALDGVDHP
eukprot:gene33443-59721_t